MQYKVTNNMGKPIYRSWNENLLSEDRLAEWKDYQAHQYEGRSPEQVSRLKRTPEATKLIRWATSLGLGEKDPTYDSLEDRVMEFKFVLKEGENVLTERQYNELKELLNQWSGIDKIAISNAIEKEEVKGVEEVVKRGPGRPKKKYISDLE